MKRPLSLLRKGSASTGLWETPRVPSERYEPRPCLCGFVACFDRRIFLLFVKNGFVVGVRCQGNLEPPAGQREGRREGREGREGEGAR